MNEIINGIRSVPLRKLDKNTAERCSVYEGPPQTDLSIIVVEPDQKVCSCFMQFFKEIRIACRQIVIAPDKITAIAYMNQGSYNATITNVLMYDGAGQQPEPTLSQSRVFGRYVERHRPKCTRLHYVLGNFDNSLKRYAKDLCPASADTVPFLTNGHMISPYVDGVGVPTYEGCLALFRSLFIMHELKEGNLAQGSIPRLIGFRFGDKGHNSRLLLKKRHDQPTKRVFKKYHVL
jgi:hypothetical protein